MGLQRIFIQLFFAYSLAACFTAVFADSSNVNVYGNVPGLSPSPYYSFRVREAGSEEWQDTFALLTECTAEKYCNTTGMYEQLNGWSNTYINFEMQDGVEVEIEITKLLDDPITKAVVHPYSASESCDVINGKAVVSIKHTGLFTVDINGQMDDQNTGKTPKSETNAFYDGPPIHTLTIFANPFLEGKPSLDDEGVMTVAPGETAPTEGAWHTLYFLPGVHDIGLSFTLHKDKSYYIPGEAVVYGSMNNKKKASDGELIRIFGHGTLSGDRLPHPAYKDQTNPSYDKYPENEDYHYRPININGASFTTVEGITIANSPYHSLMLISERDPEKPTDVKWVKIFTWRANGDGVNLNQNVLLEDSFIRTQDDATYVNGRGMRRVVFWQDCNGSTFVLTQVGSEEMKSHPIIVEDCTVVYARAKWHKWSGGRLFNMRGKGGGSGGDNIVFRNIAVEDPRPTLQHFLICMDVCEPWMKPDGKNPGRDPGNLFGILFQNITMAASSVLDEPEVLWGMEDGLIYDLIFDNVTIAGERIDSIDYFHHNEYALPLVVP